MCARAVRYEPFITLAHIWEVSRSLRLKSTKEKIPYIVKGMCVYAIASWHDYKCFLYGYRIRYLCSFEMGISMLWRVSYITLSSLAGNCRSAYSNLGYEFGLHRPCRFWLMWLLYDRLILQASFPMVSAENGYDRWPVLSDFPGRDTAFWLFNWCFS